MTNFTLAELEQIVAKRAAVTDGSSYTASLIAKGQHKAAQKLGEEAVETVIAAMMQDEKAVISESADLLYHLMVVWKIAGVSLESVMEELDNRTSQTGLQEKAARKPE
ncbi:phosphoribosyl-ATP diphosphatase [Pseudochrobactrum asaccharolyticum]|uniref:Phosphoribosyl-ATP pyrophosphatase n=1 Tax=Pseudochrobactrum asaccharolyticum TaxID=354351 RepID=A0A366E8T0_9HYPH|nr:phosphoribosyl-ATP diphosphatase [Pseudochrobactrum asaccharolyticum]RBO97818.1 phosphoribosyl-ATP pyrophosphatase [Pseudochrobactrum asaccharolyticum]